jgi:hypothetical protein
MAVNFRCDSCGKLLSFETNPGKEVECPQCHATVAVPEALASLPQPKVAPNAQRPAGPAGKAEGQTDGAGDEELLEEDESEAVMGAVASAMPVVMSVLFHVGLFVIFLFITFLVTQAGEDDEDENVVVIHSKDYSEDAGGVKFSGKSDPTRRAEQPQPTESDKWSDTQAEMQRDTGEADTQAALLADAGGGAAGGDLASQGLNTGGELGPPGEFLGAGGNAHHRVFVIDGSGSMVGSLSHVKLEMLREIGKLHPSQTFHIIFFHDDLKSENPPRRLVDVTTQSKREAAMFVDDVKAGSDHGTTDPLPALRRAFTVLSRADKDRKGKQIFLLTDGEFDVPRDTLLSEIRKMNPTVKYIDGGTGPEVAIFTYLYGYRSRNPNDPNSVESVLKAIAEQSNQGEYTHVDVD